MFHSRYIDAAGFRIHYKASSDPASLDRTPVVLVHGVGLSHRYLMPLAEQLAKDFDVFVPDLPGFGRSDKPARTLRIEQLADALADWAVVAHLAPAAFVGNSVGSQIIAHLAAGHPRLVKAIVLQGMTTDPATRSWGQQLKGWIRNNQIEESPEKDEIAWEDYSDAGHWRSLKSFGFTLYDRPEDKLPHIDRPALVVRGSIDPIISQEWAELQAELLPQGELAILPGLSHTINFVAPLPLANAIRPFLDRHLTAPHRPLRIEPNGRARRATFQQHAIIKEVPMRKRLQGASIVITGASSGIGRATALKFAEQGADVVLVGRQQEAVEETAERCRHYDVTALAIAADVTDPSAVQRVADRAMDHFQRIDVWVNNAAVLAFGRFEDIPPDVFRRVVETDFYGYVHGARAAMPIFREQGSGTLINVSSAVGKIGQPYTSPYCASNFAIVGFSECLRAEVVDVPNINVCTIIAGSIDTPFFHHAANYTGRAAKASTPIHDAEEVADAIVQLATRPKPETYIGNDVRQLMLKKTISRTATAKRYADQTRDDHFQPRRAENTEGNVFSPEHEWRAVSGNWREIEENLGRPAGASGSFANSNDARYVAPAILAGAAITGLLTLQAMRG